MITREQHAMALEALQDMRVLSEIAGRLGDVGCAHDTDEVPATWLTWVGHQIAYTSGRLRKALDPN